MLAPVKLRPFKSAYHVRAGDQMRLVCQLQRGYPQAQLSWYVGNRLVDGDFLREHQGEFRLLQYSNGPAAVQGAQQHTLLATPSQAQGDGGTERLVEINPIPAQRQQMQLTANGRGSWMEFRDLRGPNALAPENLAIESKEQQLRYMRAKLAQLTGQNLQGAMVAATSSAAGDSSSASEQQGASPAAPGWTSGISVLVVNKLDAEKHASRYSCRATTRANTDEVTTVIRVKGE